MRSLPPWFAKACLGVVFASGCTAGNGVQSQAGSGGDAGGAPAGEQDGGGTTGGTAGGSRGGSEASGGMTGGGQPGGAAGRNAPGGGGLTGAGAAGEGGKAGAGPGGAAGAATGSGQTGGAAGGGGSDYYVGGPKASDANPGTSALPFATIQRCATVAIAGDTCHINAGVYRETVTPAASGTASAGITFAATPGAQVTVDGTDPVTGWAVDSGSIYRASVQLSGTAAKPYSATEYPPNAELWANQVFIGATMVPEASYPAPTVDPFAQAFVSGFSSTASNRNSCSIPPCTAVETGTLSSASFPALGDLTGAVAYFAGGWVALSATVTSGTLTASNHTLNITFPESDAKVFPGGGNDNKVRLLGKKAFLTAANEWFYDPAAAVLYLWTPTTGVPANVFAKKRNYAFDLRGRSYVKVTGISLFATTVITDDSSDHITLDGLHGQYLSQWQTAQYDSSLAFAGIYDANHRFDSGVVLHGTNHLLTNSVLHLSSGNGVNIMGSGTTVSNNTIYDVSYGGTYTAAITIEVGSHDLTISNNTLYSTGRDVINMDTNAYPNAGYQNVRIAYNDIHDYARIDFDLGGIYVCCDTALTGSRIDHNWIHDPANTGNGIHFDNGTFDVSVDHNVIWNLKGTGDVNHGGNGVNFGGHTNARPTGSNIAYLTGAFYNNTIVSGLNDTIFNYFASAAEVANTTVRNNILDGYTPSGQSYGYIAGGVPVQDHNLLTLFSDNGSGPDPGYSDLANGDLSLQANSPAINVGVIVPGITSNVTDGKPDLGAYEAGQARWIAGSTTTP